MDLFSNINLDNGICIYHKNCPDGFGSALAVKKYCELNHFNCEYVAANHGDTPPDVDGKNVIIVDFSYKRPVLEKLKEKANGLIVIDHHISAQKDLENLDYCLFDMEHSGAVLTWKTLFPNKNIPQLLLYIEDRDLWNWELVDSKELSSGLRLIPMDFEAWNYYLNDQNLNQLIEKGRAIVEYENQKIERITKSELEIITLDGYQVPIINTTQLISEIGNALCQEYPFAVMYFETKDKRIYSLRSQGENGVDVSMIASKFGGGGHRNAAGFSIEKPQIDLNQYI